MRQEGEEGGSAAAEDGAGVDVEELGVEREGPEEAFGGGRGRAAQVVGEGGRVRGAGGKRGVVGLDLGVGPGLKV